ncbi:GNAT family N-acetyltransferase [Nocardiopsis valliformis]|uniref:GNAT family N-acetyltransferase n=1 Tax=Nocardiopsis valliformis TaxID=239974 RepID=UPI0003480AC4|nr:GNAT family N-acetyltransferase [Nocardiopsis valliformis]
MGNGTQRKDRAQVRAAGASDVVEVARVLGRAFEQDPVNAWMFPDPDELPRRSRRLYAIEAGFEYLPHGRVEVAELHGQVVGAAMWGDPEASRTASAMALLRSAPHFAGLFEPRRLPVIMKGMGMLGASAPSTPHWYLSELGTDPDVRGAGAGVALLRSGLRRADQSGLPVHLESSKAENLPFYERFGFRTTEEITVPEGPTLYAMLREAGTGESVPAGRAADSASRPQSAL